MPTRLIFIRHARSTWNDVGRWQGQADPPLSENGQAQARLLAERLRRSGGIDHLYSSDLQRAAATAGLIANALELPLTLDPVWRERGIGEWEGLTSGEIISRYPEAWGSRLKGPLEAPGGELMPAVMARAKTGCAALLARHEGQVVAIVSHGGMLLATLVYLLGLPPSGFAILVGGAHTAISQVVVTDGHARLVRLNDTAHLELMTQGEQTWLHDAM